MCEISALVQKIEHVPESVNTVLNNLKQNNNRNTDMLENRTEDSTILKHVHTMLNNLKQNNNRNTNMLENNVSFLQQELRSTDDLIKSLMDTQTMVLEIISKENQFNKPELAK